MEKKRRIRYEAYESKATEVNKKRTREEYKASISETSLDIDNLKKRRLEHEAMVEERMRRAQLLRHAVAELAQDIRKEQANVKGVLDNSRSSGSAANGTASPT